MTSPGSVVMTFSVNLWGERLWRSALVFFALGFSPGVPVPLRFVASDSDSEKVSPGKKLPGLSHSFYGSC